MPLAAVQPGADTQRYPLRRVGPTELEPGRHGPTERAGHRGNRRYDDRAARKVSRPWSDSRTMNAVL